MGGLLVVGLVIFWVDSMADEVDQDEVLSCRFIIDEVYMEKVGWSSALQTRTRKVNVGPYPATVEQLQAVDRGASVVLRFGNKFLVIPKGSSYSCHG
jgi:hypothetical protein